MIKKYYIAAIISGLLLALSWPVYGFPLLLFISFVPLLVAEKKIRTSAKKRKGLKVFLTAYIAFVIWNAITTWWLWYSTPFGMFFCHPGQYTFNGLVIFCFTILWPKSYRKKFILFFLQPCGSLLKNYTLHGISPGRG